jgi:hypothetical protein
MQNTLRSRRLLPGLVVAALACLALSMPAQAQWKWRDARGQITVSDTPPPRDIPPKDILQQPDVVVRKPVAASTPPAASAAVAKPTVDPTLEERKRRAEQEQAAAAKAEEQKAAAARQENCRRAREQLATLDSGQRIARVDANGERIVLDDAERAKEAQRTRSIIASDCR